MELKTKRKLCCWSYVLLLLVIGIGGYAIKVLGGNGKVVAQLEFAYTKESVTTNELGRIIQPKRINVACEGGYVDPRWDPKDALSIVFSPSFQRRIIDEYLSSHVGEVECDTNQIANAIHSAAYVISDEPIPIVRLSVRALDEDVAMGVLNALSSAIQKVAETYAADVKRRVICGIEQKVKHQRLDGDDILPVEEEIRQATNALKFCQFYLISAPHIVK